MHKCSEDKWKGICEFMVYTINEVTGDIAKLDLKTCFTFTPEIKQHWSKQFHTIRNDPKIKSYEKSVSRKKKSREPANILKHLKDEHELPKKVPKRIYELYKKREENNKFIRLINAVEKSHLISPKSFINAVHKAGHQSLVEDLRKLSLPIYPVNDETDRLDLCCHRESLKGEATNSNQSESSFASSEQSPLTDDSENPQGFPSSSSWPCMALPPETPKNHQRLKRSVGFVPDAYSYVLRKEFQNYTQNNNPPEQQQQEPLPAALSDKSKGSVSSVNPKIITNQKSTKLPKPLPPRRIDSLKKNSERKNTTQVTAVINIQPQKSLQKPTESNSIPMPPPASPLFSCHRLIGSRSRLLLNPDTIIPSLPFLKKPSRIWTQKIW